MNSKSISLLIAIGISGLAMANNLYETVAPLVLSSEQLSEPVIKPDGVIVKQEGILEQIDKKAAKLSRELSHIEKLRILFNVFALDGDLEGKLLDQHALIEPYILPGAGLLKTSSLLGKIQSKTIVGEAVLAARLSAPLIDLGEIIKRREALRLLVEDENLRARLKAIIESVSEAEESFLNYWDNESKDIEIDLKRAFYALEDPKMPFSKWNPLSWPLKLSIMLNRWPRVMQLNRIMNLVGLSMVIGGSTAAMVGCPLIGLAAFGSIPDKTAATGAFIYSLFGSASSYVVLKFALWQYRLHNTILSSLHRRLKHVKAIGEAASDISVLAYENPKLAEGLSLLQNAHSFNANPKELSKNLPYLVNILSRQVFNSEKFGFFSHAGNVLSGHDYMLEVKNTYHKAYEVVGELSVMLAAAEMIVAQPDRFCFPEFYTADKPELTANGLRNLLFGDNSVPYDIHLGGQKTARVMLLAGPNGAGKSGALVAVGQAINCAQALGFAPARYLRMTPFDVMESFSNVKEDPSKNLSRFMAERMRSKYIMPKLRNLKKGQFAWIGIDEPNSGTTGDVADERSYRLYKAIASHPNVICVGTSHQEKPTFLEEETNGVVKNFYPVVERDPHTKNWIRHYKIVPGKPDWWFSPKEEYKKMRMQYTKKFY